LGKSEFLKGKKILITSFSFAEFGGAALNAVELAEQLVKFGMTPTFFSYDIDGPLKGIIESKFRTTILTDHIKNLAESEDLDEMRLTRLNIEDYDYIWVGGNTIPVSILQQINSSKKIPKFIFIHMSPLIAYPLDAPLMPRLEREIASEILSISEGTTNENLKRILGESIKPYYWRNPVPVEFKGLKKRKGVLRKIAVISSSHPSQEIIGIKPIIEAKGIEVDYVGKFNKNVQVIDAKFYDKYDLIIGIGKDAKYSLVSGVPIYVYGRFGGGGYINNENGEAVAAYNFSGRGFGKKNAKTIAKEVIDGYAEALEFHEANRERFIEEFSIDIATEKLFTLLEKRNNKKVKFEQEYINWLVSTQINIMQRHMRTAWLRRAESRVEELELENGVLKDDVDTLVSQNKKLQYDIRGIYNSTSWKITQPMRKVNELIKRVK
jgi:hypothetical protein